MFSGIIAAVGRISAIAPLSTPAAAGTPTQRLKIAAGELDLSDVALGDSIACNGVCLTVVACEAGEFSVDVSPETFSCTVGLDAPGEINLEKALRLADRLGGHLVSGHVDGVGAVLRLEPVDEECYLLEIRAPAALAKYIAPKGSIAVNGVSLTTNRVDGELFSINLIPHTLERTTLHRLKFGSRVNLEVDLIARYVERMMTAST
ncbi:MAG: riboflavin synthase [Betaproteobacteria bacterium]|nr:riboflavin synthase [Betaproteobacteria bacterium]